MVPRLRTERIAYTEGVSSCYPIKSSKLYQRQRNGRANPGECRRRVPTNVLVVPTKPNQTKQINPHPWLPRQITDRQWMASVAFLTNTIPPWNSARRPTPASKGRQVTGLSTRSDADKRRSLAASSLSRSRSRSRPSSCDRSP